MPPKRKNSKKAPPPADNMIDTSTAEVKPQVVDPTTAGFEEWHTESFLTTGGPLSQMSTFDDKTLQFTQVVNIQHPDAFKLKPITISEGPLKGRQVLLLEPVTDFFRFLDLPPEIRTMIYDELMKEDESISLISYKVKNRSRRTVGRYFQCTGMHEGLTWDGSIGNWIGKQRSAHALLRVNKQIQQEAASVAYGSNTFKFAALPQLRLFLETIGSMRQYLRSIEISHNYYHRSVGTPVFHKLKDAKNFHSLIIRHDLVCDIRTYGPNTTLKDMLDDCTPFMKKLHKIQQSSKNPTNVLDIVKIGKCDRRLCKNGDGCGCKYPCDVKCNDLAKHSADLSTKFRRLLAEALGVDEEAR